MTGAGDLHPGRGLRPGGRRFAPGPLRNAALGYLAVLRGQPVEAEACSARPGDRTDDADDASLRAVVAQRSALHAVGRLRAFDVVDWAQRALELALPGDPVRVEARGAARARARLAGAIAGGPGGLRRDAGQPRRRPDRSAARTRPHGPRLAAAGERRRRGRAPAPGTGGACRAAERHRSASRCGRTSWLARAEFALGAWDEAAADAERAVSLLEESGHGVVAAAGAVRGGDGAGGPRRMGRGGGARARRRWRGRATTS